MTKADSGPTSPNIAKLAREKREQIISDNARLKEERNARRNKADRDPVEYEKQKADQKAAYAEMIKDTEGREVRAYAKVPGKTRSEHDKNARERDAARKRDKRSRATQAQKDKDNDRKWAARQRKKGTPEEQITKGLAKRATDRQHRQPEPGPYEDNPDFGAF